VCAAINESVLGSSINTSDFVLKNSKGNTVSASVSYNDSTHTATLTPSASLAASTTYTATISGVKDAAGNVIASPMSWNFTTAGSQPKQLVAAYSFNEGTGTTVFDSSGNGNNGTISNATWTSSGKYGGALVFNGTNSLVTINDSKSLDLTTGMTIEAWVNPTTVSSVWRDVIFKNDSIYYLEATSPTNSAPVTGTTFSSGEVTTYGPSALPTNAWTYLAATYDGSNLLLYENGNLVATLAHTGSIVTSTNSLQIGGDSIWGDYFAGMINNVRIYSTALISAQIQSDMNMPVSSGPVSGGPVSSGPNVTSETPASGAAGAVATTFVTTT